MDFINNYESEFSKYINEQVDYYYKKYKFNMYNEKEGYTSHNNEGDAFKHTFMQTYLSMKYWLLIAKLAGDYHESNPKNPHDEKNMDLWNNRQGRDIAREIKIQYPNWNSYSERQKNDIIAEKVMNKMKNGDLITKPIGSRKFNKLESDISEFFNVKYNDYLKNKGNNHYNNRNNIDSILKPNKVSLNNALPISQKEQFIKNAYDIIDRKYNHPDLILSPEQYFKQKIRKQVINKYYPHHNYDNGIDNGRWVTINGNHVFLKDKK